MATRRKRPAPYDCLPLADPDGSGLTAGETCLLALIAFALPLGLFAMGSL